MTEVITDPMPPILLHGPSDKEKKYDRQLRLWAASGQQALEDAHILLINSGSGTVGVETLKNLVLPGRADVPDAVFQADKVLGIGKFTIADENIVDQADLGVNFFLDEGCLGKPRSECCVKLLQELNPDVKGDWFPKQEVSFRVSDKDGKMSWDFCLEAVIHPLKGIFDTLTSVVRRMLKCFELTCLP